MKDGLPAADPAGLVREGGDGVALVENVLDRPVGGFGETHSSKSDVNFGGGREDGRHSQA